jgi:putative ABC transport system permease protein
MFKIAFRNVLRNGRRSLMTASAVAVGATALILFAEYNAIVMVGLETGYVQNTGHLSVFKKGYFEFGSGRPLDYSISDYGSVMKLIRNDPVLKPMLNVVTPTVSVYGIAGNAALDKSKTFFGSGFVPSDLDRMRRWDEYKLYTDHHYSPLGLSDGDLDHGVVGNGLARILGLCKPLKIADCPVPPQPAGTFLSDDPVRAREKAPRIDLLGSAGGAPNIVAFYVNRAQGMGARELDDSYVGMNLRLAQQLLYGNGEHKASSIVLQLNRTEDIAPARARLDALFAEHKLDLEVKDFKELAPSIVQIIGYFQAMFAFLALVLGIIVLFTIANTMGMSVMERTNEIGTGRAMGVRRGAVRRQFLLEGAILGALGATVGLVLASLLTYLINRAGIHYTPPGNATPVPLYLMTDGNEVLRFSIWLTLVVMSTLATIIPANRAARMKVVDALRHV